MSPFCFGTNLIFSLFYMLKNTIDYVMRKVWRNQALSYCCKGE
jgi:hypothetical protein